MLAVHSPELAEAWTRAGGVCLDPNSYTTVQNEVNRLPRNPTAVDVRLPLVQYWGACRPTVSSVRDGARMEPFTLCCNQFLNGVVGIELRPTDDNQAYPLGRPLLGYLGKHEPVISCFGDDFSQDRGFTSLCAYIGPEGEAVLAAETSAGTKKILEGVNHHEFQSLTLICLSVYNNKYRKVYPNNTQFVAATH